MRDKYSIITTTFPKKAQAKRVGKLLVEYQFAACAQVVPIESIYRWKGKIYDKSEVMLIIKSRTVLSKIIASVIREDHPYDVPEIVQVPISSGGAEYLKWICDCVPVKEEIVVFEKESDNTATAATATATAKTADTTADDGSSRLNMKSALIAKLNENTEILESQFDTYGLKVSSFGYDMESIGFDKMWLQVIVEIITADGKEFAGGDYYVHVNLYDKDGRICAEEDTHFEGSAFDGIWSEKFHFQSLGVAQTAQKAKIFITKD